MKRENKDLLAREQYLLRSTFFYNQLRPRVTLCFSPE